jgi:hypothetical protein
MEVIERRNREFRNAADSLRSNLRASKLNWSYVDILDSVSTRSASWEQRDEDWAGFLADLEERWRSLRATLSFDTVKGADNTLKMMLRRGALPALPADVEPDKWIGDAARTLEAATHEPALAAALEQRCARFMNTRTRSCRYGRLSTRSPPTGFGSMTRPLCLSSMKPTS